MRGACVFLEPIESVMLPLHYAAAGSAQHSSTEAYLGACLAWAEAWAAQPLPGRVLPGARLHSRGLSAHFAVILVISGHVHYVGIPRRVRRALPNKQTLVFYCSPSPTLDALWTRSSMTIAGARHARVLRATICEGDRFCPGASVTERGRAS